MGGAASGGSTTTGLSRLSRSHGWLVELRVDRCGDGGLEFGAGSDAAVVHQLGECVAWNAKAAAETDHRDPVGLAVEEPRCELVCQGSPDAQDTGGLGHREHLGQPPMLLPGSSIAAMIRPELHECHPVFNPHHPS